MSTGTVSEAALRVEDLRVEFATEEGLLRAVDGVTFDLPRGKVLALVGESGCGKSVTSYSVLRLIRPPGRITGGRIELCPKDGSGPVDIAALDERSEMLYRVRGGYVSMIFQEPMSALSPVHTVGEQICEAILLHHPVGKREARRRAVAMLSRVGIPGAEKRVDSYPHEMSGGMRQRVVIAMALVCDPEVLIADEPTTALDVTIQAQVLKLIKALQQERGTSVLFITHDLGVVAQVADEVAVMYLGKIVERGPVREVLKRPLHPYTRGLLASLPSVAIPGSRLPAIPGSVPPLSAIPKGCPFHERCGFAVAGECDRGERPAMTPWGEGREAACLRLDSVCEDGGPR